MLMKVVKKLDVPLFKATQFDGTIERALLISEHVDCMFHYTRTRGPSLLLPSNCVTDLKIKKNGSWFYVGKFDYVIFEEEPIIVGPINFKKYYEEIT